jgi:hypothetical protein
VVTAVLGHPQVAMLEAGVGPAVLVGSTLLADLLEKPGVAEWLSKITPQDAAAWEKLPPEQKALFTKDMTQLVGAAQKKGIPVAPSMLAFLAGAAGSQPAAAKSLKELREEAEKRKAAATAAESEQVEPEEAKPVEPQSFARPYTHVFDEEKGVIVPA